MLTDLSTTPVAETLRKLALDESSGDLQIRVGKLIKLVFFDHGRIVFAASNLKKDRLGEALVALGEITDDDFKAATALMKGDRKRRFGEALIAAGLMDKNELGRSVARQVKRIVLSLFDLADGAASFEERPCPIPLEYMVSLSIQRLLFDGVRAMKSRELVLKGLGDLDRWVTLASVTPFHFETEELTAEELEIAEQAKRRVTVRRLAWAPGGLAFSRLRSVYALIASGMLRPADAEEEGVPGAQVETGTFLLSVLRRRPDPTSREAIRKEVEEELERSARLDREAWLKVSRTAPREELLKALQEKMERYHALRDAVGDDQELKTDIELILGRASSMMRLARGAPPPGADAPTPPSGLPAAVPLEPAPPAAPPPPVEAKPAAPAAPLDAGPSHSTFTGSAQIEHLLMEGEVRMTVSDYANAVRTYAKLVDAAPNVAAYRLKLAVAMACWPRTAKQAEREFLEAVRLEPGSADLHYQFGLYYKAMKQRARALNEMRTAVRLNPRHKNARAELEALSPKDSALTSLKKLFK
jgi:tetratricopeptide (TPR) repeat protein